MAAEVMVTINLVRVWIRGTRAHVEYRLNGADETSVASYDLVDADSDAPDQLQSREDFHSVFQGDAWANVGRIYGSDGREITEPDIYALNATTGEALLTVRGADGKLEVLGDRPRLRRVWYPAPVRVLSKDAAFDLPDGILEPGTETRG